MVNILVKSDIFKSNKMMEVYIDEDNINVNSGKCRNKTIKISRAIHISVHREL